MKRNDIIGLAMTIFDIGLKPILSRHDCHVLFNKTLPDSQIISTIGYGEQAWICMYLSRVADMPVYRLITDQ